MKKTIIVFLTVLGFFAASSEVSAALELAWPNSPLNTSLNENTNVAVLIQYFYEWGIALGGLAAFIALIIAGVQYLTSAGNATKMKDSMDRIKSAALGLVLLFGSVLILNTINPQLTELKMPPFDTGQQSEWKTDLNLEEKLKATSEDCEKAMLYEGKKQTSTSITIKLDEEKDFGKRITIQSIDIKGGCQLILYPLNGYVENNFDYQPLFFTQKVDDMTGSGTKFGSARLIKLP